MSLESDNINQVNYEKGELSHNATRLLQGEYTREELVEEAKSLLSWVKTVYPEDYELYIRSKFKEVNKENVIKVLKNVITMCTYNSL